jgi:ribokinase
LIAVDDGGENEIVVVPGSNGRVSLDDVNAARDTIAGSTVLVLQLEIPLETVEHAARVARAAGALVLLNPAPAQSLDPSLMHTVDVLVANEIEVAALSGMGAPVEPASAARLLVGAGIQSVVVTLGSRGAVLVTNDGETDVPAFRVGAVDTTGAGDCFVGALAHALDAGRPLEAAIRFATGAAALSVQRRGAQPSMPTKAEIDAFLTSMVKS